jgi:hypothetical protein
MGEKRAGKEGREERSAGEMKWKYLNVTAEMGIDEGLPCSLCGRLVKDEIYFLTDYENAPEEVQELLKRWILENWFAESVSDVAGIVDPHSDFYVCAECKDDKPWPSELAL